MFATAPVFKTSEATQGHRSALRVPGVSACAAAFLLASAPASADYALGLGLSGDSDSGLTEAVSAEVAVSEKTWLSGIAGHGAIDVPRREDLELWFLDLGIDHNFEPVGVEARIGYWGDSDVLESTDLGGSLYFSNDAFRIAAEYQHRDFDFIIPATDFFPGREVEFDADGIGVTFSADLGESSRIQLSAMDYDYSLDFNLGDRVRFLELLSASRLSLINSLVDYRVNATFGMSLGDHDVSIDLGTQRGEIDGGDTNSVTLRWLAPLGSRNDIEFGLGLDDSELYGEATVLSVMLFFYGT